jgi:hypothetical protein
MKTQDEINLNMNHISFPTVDVMTEARFFEEQFGARIEFVDTATGSALLKHGANDIVLEAMKEPVPWHKDFHFGFELATRREVEVMYEHLKNAGARLETEIFNRLGRGSRFFGRTPGGVQFEITTREDMESKWDARKK